MTTDRLGSFLESLRAEGVSSAELESARSVAEALLAVAGPTSVKPNHVEIVARQRSAEGGSSAEVDRIRAVGEALQRHQQRTAAPARPADAASRPRSPVPSAKPVRSTAVPPTPRRRAPARAFGSELAARRAGSASRLPLKWFLVASAALGVAAGSLLVTQRMQTPRIAWSQPTSSLLGSPLRLMGGLLVVPGQRELEALDPASGVRRWRAERRWWPPALLPASARNTLAWLSTVRPGIHVLDVATGRVDVRAIEATAVTTRLVADPDANLLVVVNYSTGAIQALSTVTFERVSGFTLDAPHAPLNAPLAVADGLVYLDVTDEIPRPPGEDPPCAFEARRLDTGERLFRADVCLRHGPPVVRYGLVMGTTSLDELVAVDARTGTVLWRRREHLPLPGAVGGAVLIKGAGVAPEQPGGPRDSWVEALDPETGRRRWLYHLVHPRRDNVTAGYFVEVGRWIAFVAGDELYVLDARSGAEKWRVTLGGWVVYPPVVDGKRLFLGTNPAGVEAIDLP